MTTADSGAGSFGGPPRATSELDPADLPRLYPCPADLPHTPHLFEPGVRDLLVRYRCDGRGGILLPTAVLFTGEQQPDTLEEVVGQAVGAASVCWESMEGTGVFQSERARTITQEVCEWVQAHYGPEGPRLGMASTRELLDELRARIEIDGHAGGGGLDYRTVDDRG